MAGRGPELDVVVLDVGPHMLAYLPAASKILANWVQSKILYQPKHEVAIVLYGAVVTKNAPYEELKHTAPDQYNHIHVVHEIAAPDLNYLRTLAALPPGPGPSDWVEALIVAADMIKTAEQARDLRRFTKKVVLVSTFDDQTNFREGDLEDISRILNDNGVRLEAVAIQPAGGGAAAADSRGANVELLHQLLSMISGRLQEVDDTSGLLSVFKSRDVASQTTNALLHLGNVTVPVRLQVKTTAVKIPTGSGASQGLVTMVDTGGAGASAPGSPGATTRMVTTSDEYTREFLPDRDDEADKNESGRVVVPSEEIRAALRYGSQSVPLDSGQREWLEYSPDEKGVWVLGFLPADAVPRWHYLAGVKLLLGDVKSPGSAAAVSALVRACAGKQQVAIVRMRERSNSSVQLGVLSPWKGTHARPDCFVYNTLPYEDDLRHFYFNSLGNQTNPKLVPSHNQTLATSALVSALDLGDGGFERLKPDDTINPALQRFYTTLLHRAINPGAPVVEPDELARATFEPQLSSFNNPGPAIKAFEAYTSIEAPAAKPAYTPTKADGTKRQRLEGEGEAPADAGTAASAAAGAAPIGRIGTADPAGDMKAMVAAGHAQEALQQTAAVLEKIVDEAATPALFRKAAEAAAELRAACVAQGRPAVFNELLKVACTKYKAVDTDKLTFWKMLMDAAVTLISDEEAAGAGVSRQEAEAFHAQHSRYESLMHPAASVTLTLAAEEEEDEFAGME